MSLLSLVILSLKPRSASVEKLSIAALSCAILSFRFCRVFSSESSSSSSVQSS